MNITILSSLLPYPLNSGGAKGVFSTIDALRKKHHIIFIFPENGANSKASMHKLMSLWPEVTFYCYPYMTQLSSLRFFASKAKRFINLTFRSKSISFQKERILKPYGSPCNRHFQKFVNDIIKKEHTDIFQVEFYPFLNIIDNINTKAHKIFVHHEIRFIRDVRLMKKFEITPKDLVMMEQNKKEEIEKLNKYDSIIALTNVDKQILQNEGVYKPIEVSPLPIGCPTTSYNKWDGTLAFLGGTSHFPNIEGVDWFINKVLPYLNSFYINFKIIGKGWNTSNFTNIGNKHKISCLGFVEKIEPVLCSSIMLVPILSGSGMRMKILEAASMGVPFITTTIGVEGLNFKHKYSCLIADTPVDFAECIKILISNENLRNELSKNALSTFKKYYSQEALVNIREKIYTKL